MKSSYYTWIPALAAIALMAGCEDGGGGFSGANLPGGAGGGGGGGNPGGGGGGGGGGNTSEPRLSQSLEAGASLFDVQMGGNAGRLVFASNQNPTGGNPNGAVQIFAADVTGANFVQVTTTTSPNALALGVFDINESADEVLFVSTEDLTGDNPTLSENLFIANTLNATTNQVTRNMTVGAFNEWELSGNGTFVVFSTTMDLLGTNATNDGQLFVINSDNTSLTQITSDNAFPASIRLAENSNRIAYLSNGDPVGNNPDLNIELFVINIDGSDHRQLTNTIGGVETIASPEISDDGGRLAFVSNRDLTANNADLQYEVFTINGDGTGLTQVSNSDRPAGVFVGGIPGDVNISGNGNWVVFGSTFDFVGDNPNNDHTAYWVSADGASIGQPLRAATVDAAATSFLAESLSMSNGGDAILFASFENFSFNSVGQDIKIYTTLRL